MKVVAILSGGMDSTVLVHKLIKDGHNVHAITFDYGQRHNKEQHMAKAQCDLLGIPHQVADVRFYGGLVAASGSSLVSDTDVPEGHYAAENMKATVVPNRNMFMLSVATGYAISIEADAVAYGAHPGDHAIYPDCRDEFTNAMAQAMGLCDWQQVGLVRPFVEEDIDKAGIAKLGAELGVDFSQTWSCYNGREKHCGNCGTCVECREAFELAGVVDPTKYEDGARPLEDLLKEGGV